MPRLMFRTLLVSIFRIPRLTFRTLLVSIFRKPRLMFRTLLVSIFRKPRLMLCTRYYKIYWPTSVCQNGSYNCNEVMKVTATKALSKARWLWMWCAWVVINLWRGVSRSVEKNKKICDRTAHGRSVAGQQSVTTTGGQPTCRASGRVDGRLPCHSTVTGEICQLFYTSMPTGVNPCIHIQVNSTYRCMYWQTCDCTKAIFVIFIVCVLCLCASYHW